MKGTDVIPFKGIVYDNAKTRGGEVTAPPYDVITQENQEKLYKSSPHNIVRIDYGMQHAGDSDTDNKYTRAHAHMESWLKDGILKTCERPSYFAYKMSFNIGGARKSVTGLFGLVKLVELGSGVYPHEATHSKPKHDRMSLMTACRANTSAVYSLFRGRDKAVSNMLNEASSAKPYMTAEDQSGTEHEMWIIDDPAKVDKIGRALADVPIYIADGHHRYETAMEYRRQMREAEGNPASERPYDYVLMFLADIEDSGLCVLPTHRLVTLDAEGLIGKLGECFDVFKLSPDADIMESIRNKKRCFGIYADGLKYRIGLKSGDCGRAAGMSDLHPALARLDVVVLHKLILGGLLEVGNWAYEMDYSVAVSKVDNGEYDAAFFLNPTLVTDVEEVAKAGLRMPPKSTYFFPKVLTGFVINSFKSF